MTPRLEDPIDIGGLEVRNRLYRAPLLERAGNGPDAHEAYVREFEPNASAGVGLVMQGATPVSPPGEGCAAPKMTHVDTRERAMRLSPVPAAVHAHGAHVFAQLGHGGIKAQETWNEQYRARYGESTQRAVSELPWLWRVADAVGVMDFDIDVLSTEAVYEIAEQHGRAAGWLVEAGYDGIHIAGGTMGLFQQFLSPFYNDRDDEFGGGPLDRARFFEVVYDAIVEHAGDVPVTTKVPAEEDAPWFVRTYQTMDESVRVCRFLESVGYDALVPVTESPFWDPSIIKGAFPERAWELPRYQDGYEATFGGPVRARLVKLAHRLNARNYGFEPGWNEAFCRRVRRQVDVPVLQVGGIRDREQIDRLLGDSCDMVGMGRPFYAEPRLPARILESPDASVVCRSCNNCVVPQVAGAEGVCRTPSVLERRGQLDREGAYERDPADETRDRARSA